MTLKEVQKFIAQGEGQKLNLSLKQIIPIGLSKKSLLSQIQMGAFIYWC